MRRFGLVVPTPGTSMFKWASRIGFEPSEWVVSVTAWWPTVEQANDAAIAMWPDRTDVYAAELPPTRLGNDGELIVALPPRVAS